jgi:hypothetical protein
MGYVGLGPRRLTGVADNQGINPGNWTVSFTPAIINVNVPYFEIYKIVVQGAAGSTFTVFVDNNQWDTSQFGQNNSWDPSQPMQLNPGNTVYFYYNDPVTDASPPTVVIWLRYDTDIVGKLV